MPTELIKYCEILENKITGMTVPIHKPAGWTSFDVVKKLRNVTGFKKVGHGGTLDPFASGLLIVGFGSHTKKLSDFLKSDKSYVVTITAGMTSDTLDRTGKITVVDETISLQADKLEILLKSFIGEQEQEPPMYSAKKVGGVPLYKRARKGEIIQRKTNKIHIYSIKLLNVAEHQFTIQVSCSSGTYIRSLAGRIGESLGCGALAAELIRTKTGSYTLDNSLTIEEFIEQWKLLAA